MVTWLCCFLAWGEEEFHEGEVEGIFSVDWEATEERRVGTPLSPPVYISSDMKFSSESHPRVSTSSM